MIVDVGHIKNCVKLVITESRNEFVNVSATESEKVSFNIASEASYVYILSGQKLIKNAKNGPFGRFF